jgi:anterior pharynx defective protein 1
MQQLDAMARASGHQFSALDRLYLALGWGYGHGAVHVLFFFASILPLTAGHGTLYQPLCPEMSVFLVGALQALGFGAMLAAAMVVALDGWRSANIVHAVGAPLVHLLTALVVSGR